MQYTLAGSEKHVPHTYTQSPNFQLKDKPLKGLYVHKSASGKRVDTDKWVSTTFLQYDDTIPMGQLGSVTNPWFGLSGPDYKVYYPALGKAYYDSILASGSAGRWMHLHKAILSKGHYQPAF